MLTQPLLIILALTTVITVVSAICSRHFFRVLFFSALTGNAALFTTVYLGAFTGSLIELNIFTVAISSVLGIPGVILMLGVKLLFGL